MKSFETWKTWAFFIGLLLFSALASFAWPAIQEELDFDLEGVVATPNMDGLEVESGEMVTIQLEDYLLGEVLVEVPLLRELDGRQVHPLVLAGILAAIFVGALFVLALPLALVYVRLDRQTAALKEDEVFQEKRAEISKREKKALKELEKSQPPAPDPGPERAGWSVVSTSAMILLFVAVAGYALADTFYKESEVQLYDVLVDPAVPVVGFLVIMTLLGLVFYFRPRPAVEAVAAEGDEGAIPWGTIWVLVSGLVFVGIGVGLMLAVRAMGTG